MTGEADLMTIKVYRAESGQWSWQCYDSEGESLAGGAGYESETEAEEAAYDAMNILH